MKLKVQHAYQPLFQNPEIYSQVATWFYEIYKSVSSKSTWGEELCLLPPAFLSVKLMPTIFLGWNEDVFSSQSSPYVWVAASSPVIETVSELPLCHCLVTVVPSFQGFPSLSSPLPLSMDFPRQLRGGLRLPYPDVRSPACAGTRQVTLPLSHLLPYTTVPPPGIVTLRGYSQPKSRTPAIGLLMRNRFEIYGDSLQNWLQNRRAKKKVNYTLSAEFTSVNSATQWCS